MRPRIGITVDNLDRSATSGKYTSAIAYSLAVADVGGLPLLLPHEPELADQYVTACDGLILTGGDDPATEPFNQPTHPQANVIDPRRQAFELALLDAAAQQPDKPVLGVCLGMQLMALHAGGKLNQYLPDTHPTAESHQANRTHPLTFTIKDTLITPADGDTVVSHHRQAVEDAGAMRVIATAPDGVIEAIDMPASQRRCYLGVQWHPERGGDSPFNRQLIATFVAAARPAGS